MIRPIPSRIALLTTLLLLLLAGLAPGDGKMFPPNGIKAIPKIPRQQAVIVFHEGQETLVIESSVDTTAQELGWIIPLPAAPKVMAQAGPGLFRTLDLTLQPEINVATGPGMLTLGLFILFLLSVWALWAFQLETNNNSKPLIKLLYHLTSWVAMLAFFSISVLPGLFTNPASQALPSTQRVIELQRSNVGNYHITILQPTDAAGLDQWLAAHGHAGLSGRDREITDSYIADRWVFAATRLRRQQNGLTTPHPIRFTFPATQPVYPLRLTGSGAVEPLALDLYVFSDKQANIPGMTVEIADRMGRQPHPWFGDPFEVAAFESAHRYIGHEDLLKLTPDNTVFTRLSGILPPTAMAEDLTLRWQPLQPTMKNYCSTAYAVITAGEDSIFAICLFFFIGVIRHLLNPKLIRSPKASLGRILLHSSLISLPLFIGVYITQDTIAVTGVRQIEFSPKPKWTQEFEEDLKRSHPGLTRGTIEEAQTCLTTWLKQEQVINPATGRTPIAEDSPGNFRFVREGREWRLFAYDAFGTPIPCLKVRRE